MRQRVDYRLVFDRRAEADDDRHCRKRKAKIPDQSFDAHDVSPGELETHLARHIGNEQTRALKAVSPNLNDRRR